MSTFIEWLETLNEKDTKVRSVLRRSLSFEPGEFVPAFPYVEPFIKDDDNDWRRVMHYLVAGLWAMHWRPGRTETAMTLGEACAELDKDKRGKLSPDEQRKLTSTESRFVYLLDADADQLPHRLRQMVALLKEYAIDFDALLKDLQRWNYEGKPTQNAWARHFYRNI